MNFVHSLHSSTLGNKISAEICDLTCACLFDPLTFSQTPGYTQMNISEILKIGLIRISEEDKLQA